MFTMNTKTSAVTERFAIVQGHPHRDEQGGSLTPVTAEADDVLEKWTADQRDGGMGRHCCIKAKGVLAVPQSGDAGPSDTLENRNKPGI
jgi:hypothetical protein